MLYFFYNIFTSFYVVLPFLALPHLFSAMQADAGCVWTAKFRSNNRADSIIHRRSKACEVGLTLRWNLFCS